MTIEREGPSPEEMGIKESLKADTPENNPPEDPNHIDPEGLGAEKNRQIAEYLLSGNYEGLLNILKSAEDKSKASEVVLHSMFSFQRKDRAESTVELMSAALNNIEQYGDVAKSLIKYSWEHNQRGERFWKNPEKDETLFIDGDGELISFQGEINTHAQGSAKGMQYIKTLESYTILTGPNKGKVFSSSERPIPEP